MEERFEMNNSVDELLLRGVILKAIGQTITDFASSAFYTGTTEDVRYYSSSVETTISNLASMICRLDSLTMVADSLLQDIYEEYDNTWDKYVSAEDESILSATLSGKWNVYDTLMDHIKDSTIGCKYIHEYRKWKHYKNIRDKENDITDEDIEEAINE